MKKTRNKRAAAILCCAALAVSVLGGCNESNQKAVQVELWSEPNTIRVLQDKTYSAAEKGEGALAVIAVRNECESAQLIFTPDGDINGYTLETADLKSEAGDTLEKKNFSVYHQMYLPVEQPSQGYSAGLGNYPDPLLPLDKANAYGETKVKKGENQGVTVLFDIPANQAAGVYTGTFTLKLGGETEGRAVPVKAEVFDYDLTDEVSAKSCFLLNRSYLGYYGDTTMENYARYYEYMVAHRLMPMYLPVMKDAYRVGETEIEEYTDAAVTYAARKEISSMALPYGTNAGATDINWELLQKTIRMVVEKSVESGVNVAEKCYYYFGSVTDEASLNGKSEVAAAICDTYEKKLKQICDELEADANISGENKAAVIASARNIPCIQTETTGYNETMHNGGNGVRNWCPTFQNFDTKAKRDKYNELTDAGEEQWWYGCIGPNNPFPTYQIDDTLVSSRVVSWMQKDYRIAGNLYWETVFWKDYPGDAKKDLYHDDPMNFAGDNGDGTLLYPGDPYGIEGPVSSVRLESIADGMEEYEMLAGMEKDYKEAGADADKILQSFYTQLYSNAAVKTTAEQKFTSVRRNLLETATLAQNYGTFITDIEVKPTQTVYTLLAEDGVIVKAGGDTLTGATAKAGYKSYSVAVDFDKDTNTFALTVEKDGKSASVNIDLGGKKTMAADFETESLAGVTAEDCEASIENGMLKLEFAGGDKVQSVKFATESIKALASAKGLTLRVQTGESMQLRLFVSIEGKPVMIPIGDVLLGEGTQTVEITEFMSSSAGNVTALTLQFGKAGDEARTVYIDDIVLQA